VRVVLVEDHPVEREALAFALSNAGLSVLAQADNGAAALEFADDLAPDVVILDMRLSDAPDAPDDEGLGVAEALRARQPDIGLLILSAYAQPAYAERLLALPQDRAGIGYLLKGNAGGLRELVTTIDRIGHGEVVIDPFLVQRLLSRPRPAQHPLTALSGQETRVLALIAQGRSNLRIAQELSCQISTVEKHASNIFHKLGLTAGVRADRGSYNARVMAALTYLRRNHPDE
jgi:DNA-binding NarL/FixJ family response regulator